MNLDRVNTGRDVPNHVNVIIEIPMHAAPIKYEVDKETGAVFVDWFLSTAMFYPCNYGYVPHTLSGDGDIEISSRRASCPKPRSRRSRILRSLQGSGSGQVGKGRGPGQCRGSEGRDPRRCGAIQTSETQAAVSKRET